MSKIKKDDEVWVRGEDVAQTINEIILHFKERELEIQKVYLKLLEKHSDSLSKTTVVASQALSKLAEQQVELMDKIDKLYKYNKGSKGNKAKAKVKNSFLTAQYEHYITEGEDDKPAKEKANNDLQVLYGKGYGRTQLNKIINKHIGKK